jgi:hypothetical protein
MPPYFEIEYQFHAAGQGTFASGILHPRPHDPGRPVTPFHWVFDCGSTAHVSVLAPRVADYRAALDGAKLDLLCISHFDRDHVSGLEFLLKGLRVDTVVMPYLTLLERLVIGARLTGDFPVYRSFLTDPVAFLLDRAESIGRIIVIGGGPPDENPGRGEIGVVPDLPDGNEKHENIEAWKMEIWGILPGDPRIVVEEATLEKLEQRGTELIVAEESFGAMAIGPEVGRVWEFLFYHKPIDPAVRARLEKGVTKALGTGRLPGARDDLLEALQSETIRAKVKAAYVEALKHAPGEDINSSSLCLYAGMDPTKTLASRGVEYHVSLSESEGRSRGFGGGWWGDDSVELSILYTGDSNLRLAENRQQLRQFLSRGGQDRWEKILILQVPHHGSRRNWQEGSAAEFPHLFSIFCADQHNRRYKHPNREVVADLAWKGPVLVNKTRGCQFSGFVWRG